VRFALAQPDAGATRLVPVRGHGRVEVGRAVLRVSAGDGFPDLSRPRGVPAVGLRRFVLIFGERRWRRGAGRR
jgi:hypothetical protein